MALKNFQNNEEFSSSADPLSGHLEKLKTLGLFPYKGVPNSANLSTSCILPYSIVFVFILVMSLAQITLLLSSIFAGTPPLHRAVSVVLYLSIFGMACSWLYQAFYGRESLFQFLKTLQSIEIHPENYKFSIAWNQTIVLLNVIASALSMLWLAFFRAGQGNILVLQWLIYIPTYVMLAFQYSAMTSIIDQIISSLNSRLPLLLRKKMKIKLVLSSYNKLCDSGTFERTLRTSCWEHHYHRIQQCGRLFAKFSHFLE